MNILMKEEEKITNYQPLVQQMRQIYNQPVQVIPIVFGVTGMALKNQRMYLKKIPAYEDRLFATLQMAVMLGTTFILQGLNI